MRTDRLARAALAAALLCPAACDIPRDARGTLGRVTGDTLHVGVSEAPPWVVREGDEPAGVEPELVRAFARSLDAEIRWSWGSAQEHMEALSFYQLDLAIGGFTQATPWRKHVGLTRPYHTTRIMVAGPPGSPPVGEEEIEGRTVAVPAAGATGGYVREEGGQPLPRHDLSRAGGLVAAPDWQLVELDRDTTGFTLIRHRHVMAVPPGENGLLVAIENVLHGADVTPLLRRSAGGDR